MRTGYFARATEEGHRAKSTLVHIVGKDNRPICRYRPHKTMLFQWCADGIVLSYVTCEKCKTTLNKIKRKLGYLFGTIGG